MNFLLTFALLAFLSTIPCLNAEPAPILTLSSVAQRVRAQNPDLAAAERNIDQPGGAENEGNIQEAQAEQQRKEKEAIYLAMSIFAFQHSQTSDSLPTAGADNACSVEFNSLVQKDSRDENSSKTPDKHCSCPCHHLAGPAAVCTSFELQVPLMIANDLEMVSGTVPDGLAPGCLERPPRT